jgi:hypothetical protein
MFSLIDAADAPLVDGFKWNATRHRETFYAVRHDVNESGRTIMVRMHRVICGVPNGVMVDHKDRNGLNNCRANLREDNGTGNARNVGIRSDNKSGFKGVSFKAREQKWSASISVNGRIRNIGRYATAEAAARAYDEQARNHFGEFAFLNFPEETPSR